MKTTRRTFLKLLSAMTGAAVALDLPAAMLSIPEPTIEKLDNYIRDPRVVSEVVTLEGVVTLQWEADIQRFFDNRGHVHTRRRGHGTARIERYVGRSNTSASLEWFAYQSREISFVFDAHNCRYVVTGHVFSSNCVYQGSEKPLMDTLEVSLTAPIERRQQL